jgi:hypothetical protein
MAQMERQNDQNDENLLGLQRIGVMGKGMWQIFIPLYAGRERATLAPVLFRLYL